MGRASGVVVHALVLEPAEAGASLGDAPVDGGVGRASQGANLLVAVAQALEVQPLALTGLEVSQIGQAVVVLLAGRNSVDELARLRGRLGNGVDLGAIAMTEPAGR